MVADPRCHLCGTRLKPYVKNEFSIIFLFKSFQCITLETSALIGFLSSFITFKNFSSFDVSENRLSMIIIYKIRLIFVKIHLKSTELWILILENCEWNSISTFHTSRLFSRGQRFRMHVHGLRRRYKEDVHKIQNPPFMPLVSLVEFKFGLTFLLIPLFFFVTFLFWKRCLFFFSLHSSAQEENYLCYWIRPKLFLST